MRISRVAFMPLLAVVLVAASLLSLWLTGREHEDFIEEHAHGHHHEAPRGGTLIMLGEHTAHIELLLNAESGQLSAYLLDGHAEHPVRIDAASLEFQIKLGAENEWLDVELPAIASDLTGETIGDSSEFSATIETLEGVESFRLRTPAFTLRGVEMPSLETSFPEGNE